MYFLANKNKQKLVGVRIFLSNIAQNSIRIENKKKKVFKYSYYARPTADGAFFLRPRARSNGIVLGAFSFAVSVLSTGFRRR